MNGPQHYAEAETALARADVEVAPKGERAELLRAQVHATLALAAATIDGAFAVVGAWPEVVQ